MLSLTGVSFKKFPDLEHDETFPIAVNASQVSFVLPATLQGREVTEIWCGGVCFHVTESLGHVGAVVNFELERLHGAKH